MAKKKKNDLLNVDEGNAIVSTIQLDEIKLKDLKWLCKLRIGTTLPKSYYLYKIIMELDEQPYLDRIADLEAQLKNTLFENDPAQIKQLDKNVAEVRKTLAERQKECEVMKFNATVEELKYKDRDTVIVCRVPDDIIEAFNRQKSRLSYYKITLESIYEQGTEKV